MVILLGGWLAGRGGTLGIDAKGRWEGEREGLLPGQRNWTWLVMEMRSVGRPRWGPGLALTQITSRSVAGPPPTTTDRLACWEIQHGQNSSGSPGRPRPRLGCLQPRMCVPEDKSPRIKTGLFPTGVQRDAPPATISCTRTPATCELPQLADRGQSLGGGGGVMEGEGGRLARVWIEMGNPPRVAGLEKSGWQGCRVCVCGQMDGEVDRWKGWKRAAPRRRFAESCPEGMETPAVVPRKTHSKP